jgi:hypothetical protein
MKGSGILVMIVCASNAIVCSQTTKVTTINDTVHFCFTRPMTEFFVRKTHDEQIHRAESIALTDANAALLAKISGLNREIAVMDTIIRKQSTVIEIVDVRHDMTAAQLKRANRKMFWSNVWSSGKQVIVGVVSGAVGFGVGFGAAKLTD